VIKDLVDLKPEALFFGHGHGDHADNGAFIAAKTGATMYMTPEACGTAQTALTRMKNDPFMQADPFFAIPQSATINCIGITTAGSTPGTEVVRINQLEPLVCINSFRSLHSQSVPVDPDWGPNTLTANPDPRDATLFPAGVPLTPTNPRQPGQQDLRQGAGPGGADELVYQFVVRSGYNFSLFWNNSIGALKEGIGSNWLNGTPVDGQRLLGPAEKLAEHRPVVHHFRFQQHSEQWLARQRLLGRSNAAQDLDDRPCRSCQRNDLVCRIDKAVCADGTAEERLARVSKVAVADHPQPHGPD
jgi:hypothetical protein